MRELVLVRKRDKKTPNNFKCILFNFDCIYDSQLFVVVVCVSVGLTIFCVVFILLFCLSVCLCVCVL